MKLELCAGISCWLYRPRHEFCSIFMQKKTTKFYLLGWHHEICIYQIWFQLLYIDELEWEERIWEGGYFSTSVKRGYWYKGVQERWRKWTYLREFYDVNCGHCCQWALGEGGDERSTWLPLRQAEQMDHGFEMGKEETDLGIKTLLLQHIYLAIHMVLLA